MKLEFFVVKSLLEHPVFPSVSNDFVVVRVRFVKDKNPFVCQNLPHVSVGNWSLPVCFSNLRLASFGLVSFVVVPTGVKVSNLETWS